MLPHTWFAARRWRGPVVLLVAALSGTGLPMATPSLAQTPTGGLSTPATEPSSVAASAYAHLPMAFEPNRGQADASIDFVARGNAYAVTLNDGQALLALQPTASAPETVVGVQLEDATPQAPALGEQPLPGTVNYLVGNDASQWRTELPTFGAVRYAQVYPGIDLLYHGEQGQLEYDFDLAPGADPDSIRIAVQGVDQLELTPEGDLVLHTPAGDLVQPKPMLYQTTDQGPQPVDGGYTILGPNELGFSVNGQDPDLALTIDPVLGYSTFLGGGGGSLGDTGAAIAVDAAGNAYVTGYTQSPDFPITAGVLQPTLIGGQDAFISKLNPTGTALVYSTFLGGAGGPFASAGHGIAVDSAGDAYVVGQTNSPTFPVTAGVLQPTFHGNDYDVFVTKLNPTGTGLVYATFLGGSNADIGLSIAIDPNGNAYVTGQTNSPDFPTTQGAVQPTFQNGSSDAFVSKLNPAATALVYSTYLGGADADVGFGIATDASGDAYVTGQTSSTDFPTTQGVLQPSFQNGASDAFVSKLNPTGSAFVYSTFLGGGGTDIGHGIATDASGDAYVTGQTSSANFPTTSGTLEATYHSTDSTAFVTKLNPAGSAAVYSTFVGGSGRDAAQAIATDQAGNAYITGYTYSTDFPTTSGAVQTGLGGPPDAFVSELNAAGSSLTFSSLMGGRGSDQGQGIAVSPAGDAYVTGYTASSDFPHSLNVLQPLLHGQANAFVLKITASPVACGTTVSGTQGSVEVKPGGTTCIKDAQLSGDLVLDPGARLFMDHSTLVGNILGLAPASFSLCNSTVTGNVGVTLATGFVLVGDPGDDACAGNTIHGGLWLLDNHGGVEVVANHIDVNLVVAGTFGKGPFTEDSSAEVEGNTVGRFLVCANNQPAPTNDGQPNSVGATRYGQCAGL